MTSRAAGTSSTLLVRPGPGPTELNMTRGLPLHLPPPCSRVRVYSRTRAWPPINGVASNWASWRPALDPSIDEPSGGVVNRWSTDGDGSKRLGLGCSLARNWRAQRGLRKQAPRSMRTERIQVRVTQQSEGWYRRGLRARALIARAERLKYGDAVGWLRFPRRGAGTDGASADDLELALEEPVGHVDALFDAAARATDPRYAYVSDRLEAWSPRLWLRLDAARLDAWSWDVGELAPERPWRRIVADGGCPFCSSCLRAPTEMGSCERRPPGRSLYAMRGWPRPR